MNQHLGDPWSMHELKLSKVIIIIIITYNALQMKSFLTITVLWILLMFCAFTTDWFENIFKWQIIINMLILKVIVVFLFIYTIIYLKQSRKKQLSKQDHKSGIIIYYKNYYIDFWVTVE